MSKLFPFYCLSIDESRDRDRTGLRNLDQKAEI